MRVERKGSWKDRESKQTEIHRYTPFTGGRSGKWEDGKRGPRVKGKGREGERGSPPDEPPEKRWRWEY